MAGEETSSDDTFAAAFAQLTEEARTPATPEKVDPPPAKAEEELKAEQEASLAAEGVLPPDDKAKTEPDPNVANQEHETGARAEPAKREGETPALSDDDLVRRLAGLVKSAEPTQTQTQQVEERVEPQVQPIVSKEEQEFVAKYLEDYPDIARAEQIVRRVELQNVVQYVFTEISKEIRPMVDTLRTLADRTHLGDLQTAVPDYAVTRDDVIAWAKTQPAYLQPAYAHVIERGTVNEVADMIKRYKADKGIASAPPAQTTTQTPTQTPPTAKKTPDLDPKAKAALAALAPVNSKRSAPISTPDNSDFDGAFAAFANAL